MTKPYIVAAVQAEPAWLDLEGSIAKTECLIEEAATAGASLVAFPEVWIPGYPHFLWLGTVASQMPYIARYHESSITADGSEMARIRDAARRHSITVVLGYSERDAGTLYISQIAIGPEGEVLFHRRKVKPTHVERALYGEGDGSDLTVVDSPLGRLGALSCAEHVQPLSKYAMYAQNEQVHVASWPCFGLYRGTAWALGPEINLAATQVYAFEGGTFVIAATQVISAAGVDIFATTDEQRALLLPGGGFSRIFGPDGSQISTDLDENEEGLVLAEVDLASIALAKNAFDPAGHYSRPDATQLIHHRGRREPVVRSGAPAPAGARHDMSRADEDPTDGVAADASTQAPDASSPH